FTFYSSFAQNVTTAGNGLYKPNSSSVALSDGSTNITSPVVLDFATSTTANFLLKKGSNNYLQITNAGNVGIGHHTSLNSFYQLSVKGQSDVDGQSHFLGMLSIWDNNQGLYIGNGSLFTNHEGGLYADADWPLAIYDWDNQTARYG